MRKHLSFFTIACFTAVITAVLRLCQMRFGWEGSSLLPIAGHWSNLLLPIFLLLMTLLCVCHAKRQPLPPASYAEAFSPSSASLVLQIAGSFLTLFAAFALLSTPLLAGLCLLAAVGRGVSVYGQRKGEYRLSFLLPAVCTSLVLLLQFYLATASDPVLSHYYLDTLTLVGLSITELSLVGYGFGEGKGRLFPALSAMTIAVGAGACLRIQLPLTLYLLGSLFFLAGHLLAWGKKQPVSL